MRASAIRKPFGRRWVEAELSVQDAHDLGRLLVDYGQARGDMVWQDGEALIRASHEAEDGCVDPDVCPSPMAQRP